VSTIPDHTRSGATGESVLSGLKVVEFGHVVAGPLAGTLLADLGADVVHVETPDGGDAARKMGPSRDGVHLWWKVLGRNKRSVTVDLKTPEGSAVGRKLALWADVLITNIRASTLVRWGLDWETLHREHPTLVYLQISGYGAASSRKDAPGFGKMGEARSGVVQITGFAAGPPVHTGFSHADSVTGLMGSQAVLAALYRKAHDPDFAGEWIDLALFEPLFRLIEWQVVVYDQLGLVPERCGNRLSVAPAAIVNTYLTKDDTWVTVTSATLRSVLNVVRLLGLEESKYATWEQQTERADQLDADLRSWIRERAAADALAQLEEAGVVASKVFTVEDIMKDPTYAELGDIVTVPDPDLGEVRMQGVIPRLHEHPGTVWRTGAKLGEDTEAVLVDWLGMSRDDVAKLQAEGVI